MKLAAILLLVGVAILAYASSIAPYKDEALFMARYMALTAGQSAEYWKLRDEMITPKFQLQDYGGTFVAAAVCVFLVSRSGWRHVKSPKSRAALVGLAFATPFLTVSETGQTPLSSPATWSLTFADTKAGRSFAMATWL